MDLIHLLLIEDDPADADWLQSTIRLDASAGEFQIVWATRLQTGLIHLSRKPVGAVLLDLDLPDSRGLATLSQVSSAYPACPIVVLAGKSDTEVAVQAMQSGAQDFLVKGQVDGNAIVRAIRHAIERKRFELDLERRTLEMQALYETTLAINAQIKLSSLLQDLVERAAHLMSLPMCGLYMVQPDGQTIRLEYLYNIHASLRGVTLHLGEGLAGKVAQIGQPLAVEDYVHWEGRARIYEGVEIFRRVLAVPLRVGHEVIGVIKLIDRQPGPPWSEDEIRLASLFADQAALAVQNTRLLEAERQKSAELARSNAMIAALGQVASRLGETLDPTQILETLGIELGHLNVTVQLALVENNPPGLVVHYTSNKPQKLRTAEAMLGQQLVGLHIPDEVWSVEKQLSNRDSIFVKDPIPALAPIFPDTPPTTLELALSQLGLNHNTPFIYLPMFIKDNPLGLMAVWGSELRQDDVTAFSILANQVAAALENARLYNRIERLATLDELTGLYNRRGFFLLAEQQLRVAQRSGSEVLLIFLDVDQLKQVNDTFGHKEGDNALVETARALQATFRSADIPARISGDEFAVLAYPSKGMGAESLMERLAHEIAHINARGTHPFNLSLSAGYAVWRPGQSLSLDELLARADAQMYQVKRKKTTGELKNFLDSKTE